MMLRVGPGEAGPLLASVLGATLDGIVVVDAAGTVVAFNDRFLQLWRIPAAAAEGASAGRMLRHALRQLRERRAHADRARALAADPAAAAHLVLECVDGRTFEAIAQPHRSDGAGGGRVWSFADVTEARLAEGVLRESEERRALALRGAHDGLWDWRVGAPEIFVSARWCEMVGMPAADRTVRAGEWLARVHPDDHARVRLALAGHLESDGDLEVEHRIRHEDGGWRRVRLRGAAVRDARGRAVRLAGSQTDVTARRAAEEAARHASLHDPLTGFPNRTLLADRLEQALTRAGGTRHLGVLVVDLDRFQPLAQALGPAAGDALLLQAAERLRGCLPPGHTVARVGADQFVVLAEDLTERDGAVRLAERLQAALRPPLRAGGVPVYLTASIGIAVSGAGADGAERLLAGAWTALLRAKGRGRARHELYDHEMQARAAARCRLEAELRAGLEQGRVEVHYQPVVALRDGRIHGFEALARLRRADGTLVPPADFIPLAEETGVMQELGMRVLRAACAQMAAWQRRFPSATPRLLNVNLSPGQLGGPGLVPAVLQVLAETGLAPGSLRLELTETVLSGPVDAVAGALAELRKAGVSVAIDDFGTGYSSLAHLHRFPLDALKVDRAFVARIGEGGGEEIVRAILSLARALGLETVAEGVETEAQRARLLALGCTQAQGYLFSRPLDAADAGRLLAAGGAVGGIRPAVRAFSLAG